MDAGDFGQLKEYLKQNLTIDSETSSPFYGEAGQVKIILRLEGEPISETSVDVDSHRCRR